MLKPDTADQRRTTGVLRVERTFLHRGDDLRGRRDTGTREPLHESLSMVPASGHTHPMRSQSIETWTHAVLLSGKHRQPRMERVVDDGMWQML